MAIGHEGDCLDSSACDPSGSIARSADPKLNLLVKLRRDLRI